MENAKDTFYVTLRARLNALDPGRVMILRGVQRPGILMEEAEAVSAQLPADAFVLRWTDLAMDAQMPLALVKMSCEIHYATSGTQVNAGLDRGRALAKMDAEVAALLQPYSAQKMNYTSNPATAMETFVFWTEPAFQAVVKTRDSLSRVAKVTVFAFQEEGEL